MKTVIRSSKTMKKRQLLWVGAVLTALLNEGCTFLSPNRDAGPDRGFRADVSADMMPVPLPIEIAGDIHRISQGEQLDPNDAWQMQTSGGQGQQNQNAEPNARGGGPSQGNPSRYRLRRPASGPKSGKNDTYTVKSGDTLMKISFEKYGDVYRWREILDANKGKIANYNSLKAGTVLTINDIEYVVIEKNGQPYLIRRNDTLAKISSKVYGQSNFWKNLWMNNQQLIQDPNRIYTGFTLYYEDKDKLSSVRLSKAQVQPRAEKQASKPRLPAKAPAPTLPAAKAAPVVTTPPPAAVSMPAPASVSAPIAAPAPMEGNLPAPEPMYNAPDSSEGWQPVPPSAR